MRCPFLVGERVYLRPLEAADVEGPYLGWLNDYEVTRFLETGIFPTTAERLACYVRDTTTHPATVMLAIAEKSTDDHVGNIKLGPIHWLHRRADLGVLVGAKDRWGRGYGREAVGLMIDYAFRRLNLNKVTLGVYEDNRAAVKLYEDAGFVVEGTQRCHLFRDGEYHDRLVLGILREEYEKGNGRR